MRISLIAAVAENGVIGYKGKLPWRVKEDMQFFRKLTWGHCIVFGRRTFESIGKPLEGRKIIVLTRKAFKLQPKNSVLYASSLEEAIKKAKSLKEKELFIGGGAGVYQKSLPIADRIYLTKLNIAPKGDTYFPKFDTSRWTITDEKIIVRDIPPTTVKFLLLERKVEEK